MKHGSTSSLRSQIVCVEWTAAGEKRLKWLMMQTFASMVLATVFWEVESILLMDYLEKGRSINSKYHITLLLRLQEEIVKNGHKWWKNSALSPRQCTVSLVDRNEDKTAWIALPQPPYSPDLAPSDYWLFADIKRMPQGNRFGSNEEVISKTEVYFEVNDKSFDKKKRHRNVKEALE